MISWSIIAGVVGVLGTVGVTMRMARAQPHRSPEPYWLLGLAALFPAWLLAFLALLGRLGGRFPERSVMAWWVLSSAAALVGLILTDRMVRQLRESGRRYPPARYWLLGAGAFLPAWILVLVGLLRSG